MTLTKIYLRTLLKSDNKTKLGLILVLMLIFAQVALMRELNYWNKNFYDALQNLDQTRFTKELLNFLIIASLYFVFCKNLKLYLTNNLQIKWRKELTSFFTKKWLTHKDFLKLDHPEQRITEDINELTTLSLQLVFKIISELTLIILFSTILYKISQELFYLNILLFFISLAAALWIGKPLVKINYEQQQKESAFRYLMTFLRIHHFEIKKSAPPKNVEKNIQNQMEEIETNFNKKNIKTVVYEIYLNSYEQLCYIFPFFRLAPLVFQKSLTLGDLFQSTSAFAQVNASSHFFIESYALITRWQSVHTRLSEIYSSILNESVVAIKNSPNVNVENIFETSELKLLNSNLEVFKTLAPLQIKKSKTLLIQGPNASGKSTFINSLMGVWPHYQGDIKSQKKNILFISSESLLKSPTSLHNYFSFFGYENKIPEALFEKFDLKFLAQKDFFEPQDWPTILSQGQKQKLRFMLTQLIDHDVLILDEALCFLPSHEEISFIKSYKQAHPLNTIIFVSHNEQLRELADHKLLF